MRIYISSGRTEKRLFLCLLLINTLFLLLEANEEDGYEETISQDDGLNAEDGGYQTGRYEGDGQNDDAYKEDGYMGDDHPEANYRVDGLKTDETHKRIEAMSSQTKCPMPPVISALQCYNVSELTQGFAVYWPAPRYSQTFHKYNTRVMYFCNRGYTLLGPQMRYCRDPTRGWTDGEPSCENPFSVGLDYRMRSLEKLYENYIATYRGMSERITAAEDESRHQFTLLEYLLHDLTTFRVKTQEQQEKTNSELRSLRMSILHQRYQQQRLIHTTASEGSPIYYNDGLLNDREHRRFF